MIPAPLIVLGLLFLGSGLFVALVIVGTGRAGRRPCPACHNPAALCMCTNF